MQREIKKNRISAAHFLKEGKSTRGAISRRKYCAPWHHSIFYNFKAVAVIFSRYKEGTKFVPKRYEHFLLNRIIPYLSKRCTLIYSNEKKCILSHHNNISDDNGSVRFVEIATQTVTLTNLLTNYNKSLTNCHSIPFADNHQNMNVVTNNKTNNSSTNFIDNNNKFHNNPTATTSPTINNFNGQVGIGQNATTNPTTGTTTAADDVDKTIEMRL